MKAPLYFDTVEFRLIGRVRLAATPEGLCKLALGRESEEAFQAWIERFVRPSRSLAGRPLAIEQALDEISGYLAGRTHRFRTPLDLRGTPFQQKVWGAVMAVPYGTTTTYGAIGAQLGRPDAARAVGAANGANPVPLFVPCHRVIGSDGRLRGYGGGLRVKAALLALERGVADGGDER